MSNQKCKIQSTLINLHPNEYSQELHCNTFEVKLNKCVGCCSTPNDFSNKQCVLNNTKDIHVLNMITGKNQSIIWMKDMSWECKWKTDERKHSSK